MDASFESLSDMLLDKKKEAAAAVAAADAATTAAATAFSVDLAEKEVSQSYIGPRSFCLQNRRSSIAN